MILIGMIILFSYGYLLTCSLSSLVYRLEE